MKLLGEILLHTNTDFSVTGWMLCVIPHIRKDASDHLDSDHRKQVNNVIRTLFHGLSEDESSLTLHFFYIAYTDFNNRNGSFDGDEFIRKIKYIRDSNIHLWHQ